MLMQIASLSSCSLSAFFCPQLCDLVLVVVPSVPSLAFLSWAIAFMCWIIFASLATTFVIFSSKISAPLVDNISVDLLGDVGVSV